MSFCGYKVLLGNDFAFDQSLNYVPATFIFFVILRNIFEYQYLLSYVNMLSDICYRYHDQIYA